MICNEVTKKRFEQKLGHYKVKSEILLKKQ